MGLRQTGRRAIDGGLGAAQVLLEAVLFAAFVAGLVYLLPSRFPVLVLSLYGFICVWLLQIAALLILVMTLARSAFANAIDRDGLRATALCVGFLAAVALCNSYILLLGELWGKDFPVTVDAIPLSRFMTADQHVVAAIGDTFRTVGGHLDRLAMALFNLRQAPLQSLVTHLDVQITTFVGVSANGRVALTGIGVGLGLAAWVRLARTKT